MSDIKIDGCPICYNELDEHIYTTECNHIFDLQCILLWINSTGSNKLCPMCRNNINVDLIKTKYSEIYPEKNINEKLTIDEFLALPGVQAKGSLISLNMSHTAWFQNLKNLVILRKINYCNSYSKEFITLGDYGIVILTNWTNFCISKNYYDNNSEHLSLLVDNETQGSFLTLDNIFRSFVDPSLEYQGLNFKWTNENARSMNTKTIKCKLNQNCNFFEDRISIARDQLRKYNMAKVAIKPTFITNDRIRTAYLSFEVIQMDLKKNDLYDIESILMDL